MKEGNLEENKFIHRAIEKVLTLVLAGYLISQVREKALYEKLLRIDVEAARLVNRYLSRKTGVRQSMKYREMLPASLAFIYIQDESASKKESASANKYS